METYEKAREEFYQLYETLSSEYNVELKTYTIIDNLTMDSIEFIPEKKENLLCITTGLHGIEGFLGSVLIHEFIKQFLNKVNLKTTHIIIVHSMNPYGMKHRRKVNENNVDLNRNFLTSFNPLPLNEGYRKNRNFFLPRKIKSYTLEKIKFYFGLIKLLMTSNKKTMKEAVLLGQYEYNNGFFYGGEEEEQSTKILKEIYNHLLEEGYKQRIFIDIHTGFGPKNKMSIVNSSKENRSVDDLIKDFNYRFIQKADGNDFYEINGDMIDYLCEILGESDYATCFEFGTIGEGLGNELESLRIMIQENSVFHVETNRKITQKIKEDFNTLYFPHDEVWLNQAKDDFLEAMNGILSYYKYI